MKDTPYTQNMTPYATNTETIGMDTSDYTIGGQVNKCVPAKWWNYLFNNLVNRARQSRNDINVIYQEFLNVLSEAGITPDETESDQLLQALEAIRSAQPIAKDQQAQNPRGFVRSSGGKVNVSVNPSTGKMTANGVGNLANSVSGITSFPSVVDIISALKYLNDNIAGHQVALPPKPETWVTARCTKTTYGTAGEVTGTYENAIAYVTAEERACVYAELELEPGWYRFCVWGGSGGKGGKGADGSSNGTYTGRSGTGQLKTYSPSGSTGEDGGAGRKIMLDLYLPIKTKVQAFCGTGGKNGTNGSGSGSPGGVQSVASFNNTLYGLVASRDPAFIKPIASGSAGGSGRSRNDTLSTSDIYCYCYTNSGAGGGPGGVGCGTMIKFNKSVLVCAGGYGGAGGSGGSFSNYKPQLDNGTSVNWSTSVSNSGGSGGSRATASWAASPRLPLVNNYGSVEPREWINTWWSPDRLPELTDSNTATWLNPFRFVRVGSGSMPVGATTYRTGYDLVFQEDPVRDSQGRVVTPVVFNKEYVGGTFTYTVHVDSSQSSGLPGGIMIFKGENV